MEDARVSMPRTETSWLTSAGLRSRIGRAAGRLNGLHDTDTAAGSAPMREAARTRASSSSRVMTWVRGGGVAGARGRTRKKRWARSPPRHHPSRPHLGRELDELGGERGIVGGHVGAVDVQDGVPILRGLLQQAHVLLGAVGRGDAWGGEGGGGVGLWPPPPRTPSPSSSRLPRTGQKRARPGRDGRDVDLGAPHVGAVAAAGGRARGRRRERRVGGGLKEGGRGWWAPSLSPRTARTTPANSVARPQRGARPRRPAHRLPPKKRRDAAARATTPSLSHSLTPLCDPEMGRRRSMVDGASPPRASEAGTRGVPAMPADGAHPPRDRPPP